MKTSQDVNARVACVGTWQQKSRIPPRDESTINGRGNLPRSHIEQKSFHRHEISFIACGSFHESPM